MACVVTERKHEFSTMIRRPRLHLLVIVVLAFSPKFASASKCKGNPKVIGACYVVHGRLSRGADTVRLWLWPVGTKRMLGVTGGPTLDDADAPIWPQSIQFTSGNEEVYADFEVCPFTPERKGAMQFVCIESASHIVIKQSSRSK